MTSDKSGAPAISWWASGRARAWCSALAAACGALLTGLQLVADDWWERHKDAWFAPTRWWVTVGLFAIFLVTSIWMVIASARATSDTKKLRQFAEDERKRGYREASSKIRRNISKLRGRMARGVSPEDADELRELILDTACELFVGIGTRDVRVTYYQPLSGEQLPGKNGGEDYTVLACLHSSFGEGRHQPQSELHRSDDTSDIFDAVTASAPLRKTRDIASGHWTSSVFMGMRVSKEPRGLVCADSLQADAFPPAADDVVQLVAELLLMAEAATTIGTEND